MSLKTSATPDATLEVQQTGLRGQFNRANYDAKPTTVSNFNFKFRPYLEELLKILNFDTR